MAKPVSLPVLNTPKKREVIVRVPITDTLEALLNPKLHMKEPIFTKPLRPPSEGEMVYKLSQEEIDEIRKMRGGVVDLHPGMGGVSPEKIIQLIKEGVRITSLDYMVTEGCNFECIWCFAGSGPLQKEYLPFHTLESLTEEAFEVGVKLFILTGGEPLVYKDSKLGKQEKRGDHFFRIVEMIKEVYGRKDMEVKILTFDDVALITQDIAEKFAKFEVGLCTKGDTLEAELQNFKVNQEGAFEKMQKGYENLKAVGYGRNPKLRLVVNSVLDHTTFDGMLDLHRWVIENGFDHSIVPVHYCGNAEHEDQEAGIHSPHVFVLYHLLARIDKEVFDIKWKPWAAFTYNKTCNRNRSGLHVRANGDITACSESPSKKETDRYTFGNVFDHGFSLRELAYSERLAKYREEFANGYGVYVCSPKVCDLHRNNLCQGGCATRSAYSRIDYDTGLIVKNNDPHNYSQRREDPLCPAWTVLALKQRILKPGLLEQIHNRLLERSKSVNGKDFPFIQPI